MSGNVFVFDDFEFDSEKLELRRGGVPVCANLVTLRLLSMFVQSPGALISREEFEAGIWKNRTISESTLTVAIARLRTTLGDKRRCCVFVQTVYRRGYRFLRAVQTRAAPLPPLAASAGQERSPFVGRERTREDLRSALSQACVGSGGLTVLTGETGSGKTRVVETFARDAAAAGIPVAWGHYGELEHTPLLGCFAGLLRDLITQSPLVRPALRDPRFAALAPELTELLPELRHATDAAWCSDGWVSELASKPRFFDAVTRALSLIGEYTPFALILDDLHQADAESLALLHHLLPKLVRSRTLIVATLRNDQKAFANRTLQSILSHRNCNLIALHSLSEADVASYVMSQLGGDARALCHSINEQSGGNPFFVTMLVQYIRQAECAHDIELEIPSTLFRMILQRFAVDDETRELLTVAAVIGRSFTLSLLQAATGRDARLLMAILDGAVADELIAPARNAQAEFVFTHELVRAALYETADPGARRGWHIRVANVLDQRPVLGERSALAIAQHVCPALPEGDFSRDGSPLRRSS